MSEPRQAVLVAGEFVIGAARGDRRGDMLGGEHAGQHGVVASP